MLQIPTDFVDRYNVYKYLYTSLMDTLFTSAYIHCWWIHCLQMLIVDGYNVYLIYFLMDTLYGLYDCYGYSVYKQLYTLLMDTLFALCTFFGYNVYK